LPSSLGAQSQTYSPYNSHNTAKGVIGIARNGFVSFIKYVQGVQGGMCLINELMSRNILNLLEPGDMVMADRGLRFSIF